MVEDSGPKVYPIGAVEKMTGLTARRIRYYEKMQLLKPRRTQGNQRLYSAEDIHRLQEIKRLLAEGLGIAGVRERLNAVAAEDEGRETLWEDRDIRARLGRETGLTSLFPVSNQAELARVLEETESGEERKRDRQGDH